MKTISIFLALLNSLTSVLLLMYTLSPENVRNDIPFWLAAKVVAGLFVILAGMLTWMDCIRPMNAKHMALCVLMLIMLGVASTTWVVQLGIISGDMLNTLLVYGCSITIQGITSLIGLMGVPREVNSL